MKSSNCVMKFGGSAVSISPNKIIQIFKEDNPRFVVVSAPGGMQDEDKLTDVLKGDVSTSDVEKILAYYSEFTDEDTIGVLRDKLVKVIETGTKEELIAFGEWASAVAFASATGYDFLDAAEVIVMDSPAHINLDETYEKMREKLNSKKRCVIPGFYGATKDGDITLMSRSGSDVTGALLANALCLDKYIKFTDTALLSADPRKIPGAQVIPTLTFSELRSLASTGASVLHTHCVIPCKQKDIPIVIRDIAKLGGETVVTKTYQQCESNKRFTAISQKDNVSYILLFWPGLDDESGILLTTLKVFKDQGMEVSYVSTGIDDVTFVFAQDYGGLADRAVSEIRDMYAKYEPEVSHANMDLVIVVGEGLRMQKNILADLTGTISSLDINIKFVSASAKETDIVYGVSKGEGNAVAVELHRKFIEG